MRPGSASALRINGTRYSLRGANPDLGSASNRLGDVHATRLIGSQLKLDPAGSALFVGDGATVNYYYNGSSSSVSLSGFGLSIRGQSALSWSGSSQSFGPKDIVLLRDAAGQLAQRNGLNAQSFAIYSTYTDATNYERLRIYGQTGGAFVIASEAAVTGTVRDVVINGANRSAYIASPTNTQLRDILISHGLMAAA